MTAFISPSRNSAIGSTWNRTGFKALCGSWKRRLAVLMASAWQSWDRTPPTTGFGILMYHRVTPHQRGLSAPTWNVTPDRFDQQMRGLVKLGYEPQSLTKVLDYYQEGKPIPSHWFVVTFDDIYENVYTNAWPILREHQIPATMFLATKFLSSREPFHFDDWPHSGQANVAETHWMPVTEAQCLEMQDSGLIELGGHTHTHQDFRGRTEDLYEDLLICRDEMKTRFGVETPTFAFPYGTKHLGFSGPEFAATVERAGFRCSLTTEDEQANNNTSPFDWGRYTAEQYDTPKTLAAKLSGYFTRAKNVWQQSLHALRRERPQLRSGQPA